MTAVTVTIPADKGDTVAPYPKFTVAAIPILLSLSLIRIPLDAATTPVSLDPSPSKVPVARPTTILGDPVSP